MRRKYTREGFSAAQKRELWARWKRGESLTAVARALGKRTHNRKVRIRRLILNYIGCFRR